MIYYLAEWRKVEFCFDTKNTMASAKKRRGRERKAARKNNNNNYGGRPISTIGDWEDEGKTFGAVKLVELVRRGHFEATSSMIACYRDNEGDRPLFIRAGLLEGGSVGSMQ